MGGSTVVVGGVSSNLADRAPRAAAQSNKLFFKINLNGTDFKIRYLGAFRPLLGAPPGTTSPK